MLKRIAVACFLMMTIWSAAGGAAVTTKYSGFPPFSAVDDVVALPDGAIAIGTANPCLTIIGTKGSSPRTVCGGPSGSRVVATPDGYLWFGPIARQNAPGASSVTYLGSDLKVRWSRIVSAPGDLVLKAGTRTVDGGFALAGSFNYSGAVVKLSASGTLEWERTIDLSEKESLSAIAPASDGGIVAVGRARNRAWIMKLNGAGALVWQTFGAERSTALDVAAHSSGAFAVAGRLGEKPWIALVAPEGTVRWQRTGHDRTQSAFHRVAILKSGDIVVAGAWNGLHLAGFTPAGEPRWQNLLPITDPSAALAPAGDGFLVANGGETPGTLSLHRFDAHGSALSCTPAVAAPLTFDLPSHSPVVFDVDSGTAGAVLRPQSVALNSIAVSAAECQTEALTTGATAQSSEASAEIQRRAEGFANERKALMERLDAMLAARQFAALSSLGLQLYTSRERFGDGAYKLNTFHFALSRKRDDLTEQRHIELMESWLRAEPKSAAAAVALADTYVVYAWRARGGDYADTVSETGAARYDALLDRALALLDGTSSFAKADPVYLIVRLTAAGGRCDGVEALIQSREVRESRYPAVYRTALTFLLPRWCGNPEKMRKWIEASTDATRSDLGEGMYALMTGDLVEQETIEQSVDVMSVYQLDRDRIRRGMDDFLRRYPSPVNFHSFAYTAWRLNDHEKVRDLFRHPELGWGEFAKPVWKTRLTYDQARSPIIGLPPDRVVAPQASQQAARPLTSVPAAAPMPAVAAPNAPLLAAPAPSVRATPASALKKPSSPSSWVDTATSQWPQLVLTNRLLLNDGVVHERFDAFLVETASGVVAITSLRALDKTASSFGGGSWPVAMPLQDVKVRLTDWTMSASAKAADMLKVTSLLDMPQRGPSRSAVVTVATGRGKLPVAVLKPAREPHPPSGRLFIATCSPAASRCAQKVYTAEIHGREAATEESFGRLHLHLDEPIPAELLTGSPVLDERGLVVAVMSGFANGADQSGPLHEAEEIGLVLSMAAIK